MDSHCSVDLTLLVQWVAADTVFVIGGNCVFALSYSLYY